MLIQELLAATPGVDSFSSRWDAQWHVFLKTAFGSHQHILTYIMKFTKLGMVSKVAHGQSWSDKKNPTYIFAWDCEAALLWATIILQGTSLDGKAFWVLFFLVRPGWTRSFAADFSAVGSVSYRSAMISSGVGFCRLLMNKFYQRVWWTMQPCRYLSENIVTPLGSLLQHQGATVLCCEYCIFLQAWIRISHGLWWFSWTKLSMNDLELTYNILNPKP